MKNDIFNSIPDSEEIIKNKNFDELSNEEKLQFLKYINREEYETIRKNLLMVKSVFSHEEYFISIDKEISNMLLSVYPKNQKIKKRHFYNRIIQLINIKIPAYQLAVILIIVTVLLLRTWNTDSGYQISQSKTDTVYVERNADIGKHTNNILNTDKRHVKIYAKTNQRIIRDKTVSRNKYITDEQNIVLKQNLNILLNNINLVQNMKTGWTLENDKDIYRILVSAH